ncbi:MAG TPA: retron system putative HNH endonuclease [Candidatus Saccharimonadales bacterium]|jgi:uncharacterized protein (TIGR02646 family)|nr:retron system putative HNH endonuclease [Candidatus Saccharimonadales bacterium]
MKRIVKGLEPERLRRWKEENAAVPQNLNYGNMPTTEVKSQMMVEQGYLCAYTMKRIQTLGDCHIEHVTPRNQPGQPLHSDIDYNNLLACFPGNKPPLKWNSQYPYGAQRKSGTHVDQNNFVSPLQEDVERRFNYAPDGSVEPVAADAAARNSISVLGLDHEQLVELRKAAIEERVLDAELSADDAATLAVEILTVNSDGRYPEFCIAISQVAGWYAGRIRDRK